MKGNMRRCIIILVLFLVIMVLLNFVAEIYNRRYKFAFERVSQKWCREDFVLYDFNVDFENTDAVVINNTVSHDLWKDDSMFGPTIWSFIKVPENQADVFLKDIKEIFACNYSLEEQDIGEEPSLKLYYEKYISFDWDDLDYYGVNFYDSDIRVADRILGVFPFDMNRAFSSRSVSIYISKPIDGFVYINTYSEGSFNTKEGT